jgi:hypothetical protein
MKEASMRLAAALAAVLSAANLLAMGAGSAAACEASQRLRYDEPVELEGELKSGTGHHDAQGNFDYVYLALDKPLCVDAPAGGGDEDFGNTGTDKPVDRIQLAGDLVAKGLPVGKRVAIKGKLFGAHTMWHAEDVLIDAGSVDPK